MNKLRSFELVAIFCLTATIPGAAFAQRHPAGRPPGTRPMMPPTRTLTTPPRPAASDSKQVINTPTGEQFFIVASIDKQNSQLLLKRPTEVTVLVKISPSTKYLNDAGKAVSLASFRAGDTVWAKFSGDSTEPTVTEMREGEMTLADLHRYYLDYPIIK